MTILKYFISIYLVISSLMAFSQEHDASERQFFIRPGIDLSRIALPFLEDYQYIGFEASVDAEIKYKFFPTIETGWTSVNENREDYNYESNGSYYRIGMNYNMLKYKHILDRNIFFIGGRFAFSNFNHQFSQVNFENAWGNYYLTIPKSTHNVNWIEGVIGLKGEIIKNLYMGYTIRVKVLTSRNEFESFKPYIIPGFGKGDKTTTVGMSYSISYAIPIKKATTTP